MTPERRARLLAEAAGEFAEYGYEQASLNRIIRATGLSKSSFYHFVDGKADLYEQTLDALTADFRRAWTGVDPRVFETPGFWGQLEILVTEFLARAGRDESIGLLIRLFFTSDAATDPEGPEAALATRVRGWLADVLRAGQRAGRVRDDLPADLLGDSAFAVVAAIDAWIGGRGDAPSPADLDAASRAPLGLVRAMLEPIS